MHIIAGPCTIESQDHIDKTAKFLAQYPNVILKGGCYKPLTWGPSHRKPHQKFNGQKAVGWLCQAGYLFGLQTISECMYETTVGYMSNTLGILQVGARNMQNFALLERLNEYACPILLKRHYGASLDDLYAATTYFTHDHVWVCERGILAPDTHGTRFILDLQAILAWKDQHPNIPICVDVSHGCFNRRYVSALARAASVLEPHGILIDVHPSPKDAWVDPETALDFNEFNSLMEKINV